MQTAQVQALSAPRKTRSLLAALLFAGVGLCSTAIAFVPYVDVLATSLAMLLCLVVPAWYRYQRGEFDAFESIQFVGLLHFAFFGMGAIWCVTDPSVTAFDKFVLPYIPQAAFYALLGYVGLMIGYFGPWRSAPRSTVEYYPRGVLYLAIPGGLGFLGLMSDAMWSRAYWMEVRISALFSVLSQFRYLFLFAWALGWLLVFSGRATPNQRRLVWVVFVPAALIVIVSNLTYKFLAVAVVGLPLISFWYARRRLPWRMLVALLLVLIFVIFPFHNTFRTLDASLPIAERVERTARVIETWDAEMYLDRSIGRFKSRVALINQFAVVLRDVPRWVPYAYGRTLFLPAVQYFIPRVIWKDKPTFQFGREFAVTFRQVNFADKKTTVTATVPGELYWNFDLPGIVLGMAVWGFLLRWLYRRYGATAGLDPVRRATHIVLLATFAVFGASLAANLVGVLRLLLMLEALRWLGLRFGLLEPYGPPATAGADAD